MTSSMTAFARQQAQEPWGNLIWEIRSVNHRYLEPHFRLPETMKDIEPDLRVTMGQYLQRGKVEVSLKLQLNDESQSLNVNTATLEKIQKAVNDIEHYFINASGINPMEILQWPGVLEPQNKDLTPVRNAALHTFKNALKTLCEMRQREGAALKSVIHKHMTSILNTVANIRHILPDILTAQRQKIIEHLEELKVNADSQRLEQEMAFLAQKADVDEELDRLETHVQEVKRTLARSGSIGRRLDFLMQELNREANTLSSKSVHSELTQYAIDLKVVTEKAREQIQNLE